MTEIEPTIDNVREGDSVTIETGTLGEPGYSAFTVRVTEEVEPVAYTRSLDWVATRARTDDSRITRITRPAPPIPDELGARFWAVVKPELPPHEFMVIPAEVVSLETGITWNRKEFLDHYTVVPAPKPETVPVPADLIREAEEWNDSFDTLMRPRSVGVGILTRIVRAVREREGADDE